MNFSADFLQKVRERTIISEIISTKVKLVKKGHDFFGLCPFHQEKTPSFKVNDEKGFFYCFGCGEHGDSIAFIMKSEGLSFSESVEKLANRAGIEIQANNINIHNNDGPIYEILNEAKKWFIKQLKNSSTAIEYLKERKIKKETIELFEIGFSPDDRSALSSFLLKAGFKTDLLIKAGISVKTERNLMDRFFSRIIFPILDVKNRCIGFGGRTLINAQAKYINSPESPVFDKSNVLYGYNITKRSNNSLFLAEGYLDVISMIQAGFINAVAPLGTAVSEAQIIKCWKICNEPIAVFDGDAAGKRAAIKLMERVLPILKPGHSFLFAELPAGEDPDSLIKSNNINELKQELKNAQRLDELLWKYEVIEKISNKPENMALVFKSIREKLNTINDNDVKQSYKLELRKKWKESFSKYYGNNNKKIIQLKKVSQKNELKEKILLATIINHPNILLEISNHLERIEFMDAEMDVIRNSLLAANEIPKNSFWKYLEDIGYKNAILKLRNSEIYLHAAFAKQSSSDEEALNGWLDLWSRFFIASHFIEDIKYAESEMKNSFSLKDWKRLKLLKDSYIGNK